MFFKSKKSSKLKVGLMGLAAKPIPPAKGNICAPNEIVYHLALGLQKAGHEVFVFTGKDSSPEIKKVVSAGLKSTWNQFGADTEIDMETYTRKRVEYEITLSNEAVKYFKEKKIEFVHSHDFRTNPTIFAKAGIPTLYTVHGDLRSNSLANDENYLEILRNKNFGFSNISSDNVKFCKEKKINFVAYTPNGVDTEKFKFANKEREGILVVARMIAGKKIKEIIKIATDLGEKIILIGPEGPTKEDKEYFLDLKQDYFIKPNVQYVGYLSQEKIVSYYQKAKVMLFISANEGMPLSILEAQSAGLPVVANKVGGTKDIILEGKTGYFIKNIEDIKEIKSSIEKAIKLNPADCRKNIDMNFSYDKMVKNYLSVYRKFLKEIK